MHSGTERAPEGPFALEARVAAAVIHGVQGRFAAVVATPDRESEDLTSTNVETTTPSHT